MLKKTTKKLSIITLVIILMPVLYSYFTVPLMSYYKDHNPTTTNMIQLRAQQAAVKGLPFSPTMKFIPYQEISPDLIKAVVFSEDSRFYTHRGIDLEALKRSFELNSQRKRIMQGGSTLTMQLCKNLFLSPERKYSRKLIEIILALRMELTLPKWRILELYLNYIEWGNGVFGAEAAANYYFKKTAKDLNAEEAAFLASIIINPRVYKLARPNPTFERRQKLIANYLVTGEGMLPGMEENSEELLDSEIDHILASAHEIILSLPEQAKETISQPPTENQTEPNLLPRKVFGLNSLRLSLE